MPRKDVAILSVAAQEDNLGDIEIREKLFDCIARTGMEIVGYRGRASDSYMEPFLAHGNGTWSTGMAAMQLRFLGRLIAGRRMHFFMAPGPAGFSSRPGAIAKSLVNLANMALSRLSGGTVHIVGRAYRGSGLSRITDMAAVRLADSVCVRDELSNRAIDGRGLTLPDLAFSGEAFAGGERGSLAICVREESDLDESLFEPIVAGARLAGATPVFVTQVRRDNAWMQRMARRYGSEIVEWPGDTAHSVQRERVEATYRACHAVVSNRLHGLIMGVMAGATPIPLTSRGNTKLLPTLRVVFPDIAHVEAGDLPSMRAEDWNALLADAFARRPAVVRQLAAPERRLREHFSRISRSISGSTEPRPAANG